MRLTIPELSLVALVGTSGSGKSTFARKHFLPTEVVSSDHMRALVSDDENDQSATGDAFDTLHYIAGKRLGRGRIVVVDATNVQVSARKPLIELARQYHVMPVAIVIDVPEEECHRRNAARPDRQFGEHVVRRQAQDLRRSIRNLQREGFRYVYHLKGADIDNAEIIRERMWTDRRDEHGPFDIIGDIHGCFDELVLLLQKLGYDVPGDRRTARHPEGRKAVFLGDLVDRGPDSPGVLRLVKSMVDAGDAICVPGNHENKLVRKLKGRDVQLTHGIAETLEQFDREPPGFRAEMAAFLESLVSHFVLDDGKLVVCHAGLPAEMHGRASGRVRDFALYGETTGETDEYGLPVRYNWARDYRATAMVVYGHTPVPTAEWENNTICLDTGCVFGGSLTALRYPERTLESVPAALVYYEPVRPFPANDVAVPPEEREFDLLKLSDIAGRRLIRTEMHGTVAISEEHAAAALEVMSRWAVDPRWLVYLPPTMSPSETTSLPDLLEHPAEAFSYFRSQGVGSVVCQEKHMGSRAIAVVCRNADVARRTFRVADGTDGIIYTRTGRRFFEKRDWERDVLEELRVAIAAAGLWDELETDWLLLDCEIMPWSAKAEPLIRQQYASVAASGLAMSRAAADYLSAGLARGLEDIEPLNVANEKRLAALGKYRDAYRRYSGRVEKVSDLRVAPFHLLASHGAVHSDRDHSWHMAMAGRLAEAGGILTATPNRIVDVTSEVEMAAAVAWWTKATSDGSEGMVVKPLQFAPRGRRGLIQPAIKVRGPEYLRIIYGPEYLAGENLGRLRSRGLSGKRALALREFALGIEGLTRFVRGEPLYRVHECVFGVLALESEPIDPRL